MFTLFSIFYVLIAAAMIVLILLQRGEGADAGAGFGGGASGTVFGARGASSFLTRATAALATLFFIISLAMAIYLSRTGAPQPSAQQSLGVMAGVTAPAKAPDGKAAPVAAKVPVAPAPSTSSAQGKEPAGG